jgi:hypothetical protein
MRAKILIQGSMIRAGYGIAALLFPGPLTKSVGLKEIDPEARYFNRLFGGRDLLIAGQTLAAVRAGNTMQATMVNLVCEATDTVSLVQELRTRGKLERTLIVGLLFNVVGYLTWVRALLAGAPADAEQSAAD